MALDCVGVRCFDPYYFQGLLSARWFSRAWCVHESRAVKHAKVNNPVFLCFAHDGRVLSFEFRFIQFLVYHLCETERPPEDVAAVDYYNTPEPTSLLQLNWRLSNVGGSGTAASSLLNHGLQVLSSQCRDLEDIVSIALNTSRMPLTFRGSAKTREDILGIFAAISIASGEVVPLVLEGGTLQLPPDTTGKSAVSWMKRPYNTSHDEWPQSSLANTIHRVESEYIELDLYLFANLPTMATQSSMTIAAAILAEHNLEHSFGGNDFGTNCPDEYALKIGPALQAHQELCLDFGQQCLALAIDCGIDWIRRFPLTLTPPEPLV